MLLGHLLVYMINKQSPKLKLKDDFFKDNFLINRILFILEKFLKVHIKNQIDNGAEIIQIFDSWAGLLEEKDLPNYVYIPTLKFSRICKIFKYSSNMFSKRNKKL